MRSRAAMAVFQSSTISDSGAGSPISRSSERNCSRSSARRIDSSGVPSRRTL